MGGLEFDMGEAATIHCEESNVAIVATAASGALFAVSRDFIAKFESCIQNVHQLFVHTPRSTVQGQGTHWYCLLVCADVVPLLIPPQRGLNIQRSSQVEVFQLGGIDPLKRECSLLIANSVNGFRATYRECATQISNCEAPGCAPPRFYLPQFDAGYVRAPTDALHPCTLQPNLSTVDFFRVRLCEKESQ
eukprot:SAG11_NODE_1082_length_5952_cov_2.529301_1_plen_190_part_00